MNKYIVTLFTLLFFQITTATSVFAVGFGFYLPFGIGESDTEIESDFGTISSEWDTSFTGLGFVFDTNPAGHRLFNYRLNFGYEAGNYEFNSNNTDYYRLVCDNSFGFGLIKTEKFRLWVGPRIRIAYMKIDERYGDTADPFGLGIGPVVGLNFNIGPKVTLGFDVGYRYTKYWDDISSERIDDDDDANAEYELSADYESDESEFFVNFSLMFRTR